jgi:hypothetical protein
MKLDSIPSLFVLFGLVRVRYEGKGHQNRINNIVRAAVLFPAQQQSYREMNARLCKSTEAPHSDTR